MRRRHLAIGAVLITALASPVLTQNLDADLQRARQREAASGDCRSVLAEYTRIAEQGAKSNRAVAAEALLRAGLCHESLGDGQEARIFERLASGFKDLPPGVEARNRLARAARQERATVQLGTAEPRRVCAACVGDKIKDFTLSPDGRWIGYTNGGGTGSMVEDDLMALNLTNLGDTRRLVDVPAVGVSQPVRFGARRATWSPDMQRVAYQFRNAKARRPELRVMENRPGGRTVTLVDNPEFTYIFPTAWAPDGKSILVMIQRPDDTWQLARVSARTGAITVLKSLNWDFNEFGYGPELSPNGKWVAYFTFPGHGFALDLNVIAFDGSQEHVLAAATRRGAPFPVWTPDGTRVVYKGERGPVGSGVFDLYSIDFSDGRLDGIPSRLLPDIGSAALVGSTKSGVLYYVRIQESERRIFLADPGPNSRLTRTVVGARPVWSPDGQRIAFHDGQRFRVRSFETGEERSYETPGFSTFNGSQWFHDGSALLVRASGSGKHILIRIDLRTSEIQKIVDFDPKDHPGDVWAEGRAGAGGVLSADDKTLFLSVRAPGVNSGPTTHILALDVASGNTHPVASIASGVAGIFPSPDGRVLAVRTVTQELATVSLSDGQYHQLTDANPRLVGDLVWAPDSRSALFAARDDAGGFRLARIASAGGAPEILGTVASSQVTQLRWEGSTDAFAIAPNGKQVAFTSSVTIRATNEVWSLDLSSLLKNPQPATRRRP